MGQLLIDTIAREGRSIRNIVDIGTWNGLGSTLTFVKALQYHAHIELFSVESNRDKVESARANLAPHMPSYMNVQLLWGHLVDPSAVVIPAEIFPEFASDPEYQRWHSIDMENMAQSPCVLSALPETIDFVLFDGGEFTTYSEFVLLFPRCVQYIALDDVRSQKCLHIRSVLTADPLWEEVAYLDQTNGFSLFRIKGASHYLGTA